jgi:hypothetical protein
MLENLNEKVKLYLTSKSEWFKRLRQRCEEPEDDPNSGWPSTAFHPETIVKVHKPVFTDDQMNLKLMQIRQGLMHQIFIEILEGERCLHSLFYTVSWTRKTSTASQLVTKVSSHIATPIYNW